MWLNQLVYTFSTSERQKRLKTQNHKFLTLLTSKCASRHNGVHFFNLSTSKSALKVVCFVHFDLEMCFAPQQRALFHTFSTSESELPTSGPNPSVFGTFDLEVCFNSVHFFILFRHLNFQKRSEPVSFWHF